MLQKNALAEWTQNKIRLRLIYHDQFISYVSREKNITAAEKNTHSSVWRKNADISEEKGFVTEHHSDKLTSEIPFSKESGLKITGSENSTSEMPASEIPASEIMVSEKPALVINRTRDVKVSLWCEKNNITVWNSSFITEIGNNKWKALEFFKENVTECGIKFPETFPVSAKFQDDFFKSAFSFYKEPFNGDSSNKEKKLNDEEKSLKDALSFVRKSFSLGRSIVIKTVSGHGGSEVFLVSSDENHEKLVEKVSEIYSAVKDKNIIVQEFIPSESRDMRVYVLHGNIYAAVLRRGTGTFKSNYSLGGSAVFIPPGKLKKYEKTIENFIHCLSGQSYGFLGIDFLISPVYGLVFNEIEEMCGTRMLYSSSDKDLAADLFRV